MRINLKAALLSAFILPGLGQLYKGDKLKGAILIALVNIFLLATLFLLLQAAGPILASQIGGPPDASAVLAELKSRSPAARWLLSAFFGLWIFGVVDAARQ
ncbi:MAG: hypothetical protein GJT30_09235 [Geobacter sp.]|nr:hypothetical protein [Geobacter sp.]